MTSVSNNEALAKANAVCVVFREKESVGAICYNNGAEIRTYLPDAVDGRWSGPLLTTASEVLAHLAQSEEPCSVPVKLAQQLFHWSIPFANLQRAAAIERRLAAYEEELEQTYDEDLPGLNLDVLRSEHQARVEHAREQAIATLLEERKRELEGMSDEELLEDDDEE